MINRPATPNLGSFGAVLYEMRVARSCTQANLAERSGLSASYLSELENARRGVPSRGALSRIAQALGLEANERKQLFEAARNSVICFTPEMPSHVWEFATELWPVANRIPKSTTDRLRKILHEQAHISE